MNTHSNKIGLIGCGVVGQGFYNYLKNNNEENLLKNVIVRDTNKNRNGLSLNFSSDYKPVIYDLEIKSVVELISDDVEAYKIVSEALKQGKKVVSANKKMIAKNLKKLIEIEKNNNGRLLYEGAVCGSIPIIKAINSFYSLDTITEIKGIFNGSTNYILTQIFEHNTTYKKALRKAQNLGFAEANPESDVSGSDALYKLLILTTHAFGKFISPKKVLKFGIENISKSDIDFAINNNLKIKLIATASCKNNKLILTILPTFVNRQSNFYNVDNEYNAIEITSTNIGKQVLKGKGAGSLPTGLVVYNDYKEIDEVKYNYNKLLSGKRIKYETQKHIWVYSKHITLLEKYIDKIVFINQSEGYAKILIEDLIKLKTHIFEKNISIISLPDSIVKKLNTKYKSTHTFQLT